jgi:hypothetical protein
MMAGGEQRLGIDSEVARAQGSKVEGEKWRASILTPMRSPWSACSTVGSGGAASSRSSAMAAAEGLRMLGFHGGRRRLRLGNKR